ncbi:hypothetical protein BATDEDRAFT_24020 [Batrachochytrium dendrobatidis JAM81]|uniref:Mitochondrial import receptor subunit Tom22 n=1 Tax=Batrachochytrium dendrobatidis (strain JAM81 / FGSC 10211) TaxID=684364 RepID=F4NZN9_BATDJ|nr:uncharacterized protein BATDEDRAFT_24020 [Batrachochytrium dendrobatidis JAM81]EGF81525.1 hypothetical protein BATDEDRAFT_24020 [Batrachochytrium dendrobatidis JAM81]KAJ8325970.1 hypothetical protein O5D80_005611 [Batrachochytrium dendrobatidis]KAK5669748.1 hypothetical protein QVD99_004132 [Batrachochytrium dendrobatidis]|eukprot:XP_006677891.1 hypothetical protein BATDEDRAFT_24020 [Batrachochytrium dendrobatidis JAM81]
MVQLTEVTASTENLPAAEAIVDEKIDAGDSAANPLPTDDENDDDYEDDDLFEAAEELTAAAILDLQTQGKKSLSDSDDEDDDVLEESLLERLAALVDIVPPTARAHMCNTVATTFDLAFMAGRILGSAAWVIATGGILVFLPLALSVEREQVAIMQDQQMRQQQQVAQQAVKEISV